MPRRDGTGPMGTGAMTGRAAGFCNDTGIPEDSNYLFGRNGFGYGRNCLVWRKGGNRLGRWNIFSSNRGNFRRFSGGFGPTALSDPALEKNILKNQATALQQELDQINIRLQALESDQTDNLKQQP